MGRLTCLICVLLLSACSRPAPFTEYLVQQLLDENLSSLTDQPVFEVKKIEVQDIQAGENTGSAETDIVLVFPKSLAEVAKAQQLKPDDMIYIQYKGSFGDFLSGEVQRHHARYHFQRRGKKWRVVGSEALAPPDVTKP